jgi:paired amphipathic helix protein Sin3a
LQVKIKFADQQDIYVEFLDIIKSFQEQQIDTPGVIAGVSRLFAGDDDLLQVTVTHLPHMPLYR